jgi:hypothetical protein
MARRGGTAVVLLVLAACSRHASSPAPTLPVRDVPAAVAAVQALAPAAQFTEINASPDGVNVFAVTAPGKERSYLYTQGKLGEPGPEQSAEGDPFALTGVGLDQATKLAAFVAKQYPGSKVTSVALTVVKPNGLVWAVRSQSVKGGLLNSLFTPDGQLISAFPAGS